MKEGVSKAITDAADFVGMYPVLDMAQFNMVQNIYFPSKWQSVTMKALM